MKSAIINSFGSPEVFEITEKPIPEIKENQLLIKAYASCVNPIDWKQRIGNHRFIMGKSFPITLGYDTAGIVEKVGSKVSEFKVGDRVCGSLNNKYGGAYAAYVVGEEKCFSILPDSISYELGAALAMVGLTIFQAFRKINLKKGQHIAINGAAGGLGHVAVQMAKYMGANVTAISSESHAKLVKSFQPDEIIDYKKQDILKSDLRCDIFFDAVGAYNYLTTKQLINRGGVYYTPLPRLKLLLHNPIARLSKSIKVKTSLMKNKTTDLQEVVTMVEKGIVKVHIDKVFILDKISEAHAYVQAGRTEGKVVIKIRNS